MPAAKHLITVEKGASFRQRFVYKTQAGDPIDISALADIQMQVRDEEGSEVLFTANFASEGFAFETDGTDGVFILTITPEQSLEVLTGDKHLYDLLLIFSPTSIVRLLYGTCRFSAAITIPSVDP